MVNHAGDTTSREPLVDTIETRIAQIRTSIANLPEVHQGRMLTWLSQIPPVPTLLRFDSIKSTTENLSGVNPQIKGAIRTITESFSRSHNLYMEVIKDSALEERHQFLDRIKIEIEILQNRATRNAHKPQAPGSMQTTAVQQIDQGKQRNQEVVSMLIGLAGELDYDKGRYTPYATCMPKPAHIKDLQRRFSGINPDEFQTLITEHLPTGPAQDNLRRVIANIFSD